MVVEEVPQLQDLVVDLLGESLGLHAGEERLASLQFVERPGGGLQQLLLGVLLFSELHGVQHLVLVITEVRHILGPVMRSARLGEVKLGVWRRLEGLYGDAPDKVVVDTQDISGRDGRLTLHCRPGRLVLLGQVVEGRGDVLLGLGVGPRAGTLSLGVEVGEPEGAPVRPRAPGVRLQRLVGDVVGAGEHGDVLAPVLAPGRTRRAGRTDWKTSVTTGERSWRRSGQGLLPVRNLPDGGYEGRGFSLV